MNHMLRTGMLGFVLGLLAAGFAPVSAQAATKQVPEAEQLSAQLAKLSSDPVLGQYATGQRTLARMAISKLQNAGRGERAHALFMAKQRVALARAAAEVGADRAKLTKLENRHDQIMLEASQADAAAARAALARQRLQYQAAVVQAQMLQEQGAQSAQQVQHAQAEAAQAKKLAAAQARAARLARKEAKLASAATKALQTSHNTSSGSSSGHSNSLELASAAFEQGSDNLTGTARHHVADFARAHAKQKIVVEPRGSSDARVLAGRRAVSVEAALEAAGAGRVSIQPVAKAKQGAEVEIRVQK
jgi:hypothetical protein